MWVNTTNPQSQTISVASLENKHVVWTWHPFVLPHKATVRLLCRVLSWRFACRPQPTWEKLEISKASLRRALKRRLKAGEPCTRVHVGHREKLHFSEGSGWGLWKGQLEEEELGAEHWTEPGYGNPLPGTVLRAGCAPHTTPSRFSWLEPSLLLSKISGSTRISHVPALR